MPNLLKTSYVNISNKDKRVIDMNALMEKKLEIMREKELERQEAEFSLGLDADVVEDGEYIGERPEGEAGDFEGLFRDESGAGEQEGTAEDAAEGGEAEAKQRPKPVRQAQRADASAFIEKANREAAQILEDAEREAAGIIENAKEEAQQTRQAVYEEAHGQGYADGHAEAEKELEAAKAELKQTENELRAQYAELFDSAEADLVETITDIYQYIFDVDLSSQRQILTHLIETTMRRIEGTRSYLIHVSPDDVAFVGMQKKTLEAAATIPDSVVEIIEDISLSKNQCYIETDGGIFDCGLDTELTELTGKIRLLSYEKNQQS